MGEETVEFRVFQFALLIPPMVIVLSWLKLVVTLTKYSRNYHLSKEMEEFGFQFQTPENIHLY